MKRLTLLLLAISIGFAGEALCQAQEDATAKRMTATLAGRVVWRGQDLSHTSVSVYRDEALQQVYISGIPQLGDGQFTLRVEPGRYYLVAYVDVDKSGSFDTGDGLGMFGITDWGNKNQNKQVIEVQDGEQIQGLEIPITARATYIDNKPTVVPLSEYEPSQLQQFQTELRKATSGCSGTLNFRRQTPENPKSLRAGSQALILAYTDLSWKYRAGIARVTDVGSWTLNLPPGKYYLMAIVDNNRTNKLDTGDDFGFYGVEDMRKRGNFPQPVLVSANKFTENIEVAITATYQTRKKTQKAATSTLTGILSPVPGDVTARVEVYSDPALVAPVASAETAPGGAFRFALPPDEYYVIANLDADKDGRYSKGDGLGGYGTIDITTQPPTALTLAENEAQEIEIVISARYDDDGRLHATPPSIEAHIEQGSITGRIVWDGHTVQQGILTLSYAPDFSSPIAMPITVSGDGSYQINVLPGSYYVMAVVDANNDQKTGIADGVGIYGTRHPVRGEPTAVHVFPGETTAHIDIAVLAIYIDADGNMAEIEDGGRWEIRKLYGEPEDTFRVTRSGRLNEEWNYWTKGLSFIWKANGSGWELSKTESFTLKEDIDPKLIEKNIGNENVEEPDVSTMEAVGQLPAFIYFAYDGMIWGISPDGNSTPLGIGHNPTVANDGTLIYQDRDGNVIIRNREMPDGGLLFDRRKMAADVAISPDAQYVAYTRPEFGDRSRVVILHISSGSEFTVPSTALQSFTPAWNSDGTMLTYVTAGSIENPDAAISVDGQERRNIYAFDQIAQSVEPIVISPDTDDIEPTWSPANPNQLAFTRKVGDYQQIWLVTYSSEGVPTEKQLTRRGGSHPAWVPPEGRWLIYENNGQLWKIDTTNPETTETTLIHNGHVVFGREPAAAAGNLQTNTPRKN
ncbi:hypothetical protein C6496_18830 [Candidatus Poribacteria bacterium]|nr:MAG: hypothetical protein C6496_18830 [Candidatus Poribacteria bacterium]